MQKVEKFKFMIRPPYQGSEVIQKVPNGFTIDNLFETIDNFKITSN